MAELHEGIGELQEAVESLQAEAHSLGEGANTQQSTGQNPAGLATDVAQLRAAVEELQSEVGSARPLASVEQVDGLWDRVRELGKQMEKIIVGLSRSPRSPR